MARKSASGQPKEPAGKPGDVPEDVVTPAADESAEADDVAADEADAMDEAKPEADAKSEDADAEPEGEDADAEADAEPEDADADAEPEPESDDEEAEAGLADSLFDLNDEDTDEVRQPVRKLTKAPVKKAQTRKRAATTAPTTTGPTTPWAFVRQAIGELRKVVWPSGDTVGQYFIVVLVFVLFVMAVVFGLDTLFGWGLMRIFR
ncbi:MAG: preprotein translocase subunit SecE [Propionibacteriaceae bacterium]|nr:preprotein translocase subunit SecE [Propionibacteriaceae bacterium]